jgi:hypothetical protein
MMETIASISIHRFAEANQAFVLEQISDSTFRSIFNSPPKRISRPFFPLLIITDHFRKIPSLAGTPPIRTI